MRDIGKSDAWKQIWNALVIAIGIVLILIGFAGLFAVSVCVFANSIIGFDELINYQLFRLIEHTPEIANLWKEGWVKCLAIAAAVLPFTGMLTSGVQLVSGYKCKKFRPGLIIFILWLMTLLALAILVVLCLL